MHVMHAVAEHELVKTYCTLKILNDRDYRSLCSHTHTDLCMTLTTPADKRINYLKIPSTVHICISNA